MRTLYNVLPTGRRHYRITLADALDAHREALTYSGRIGLARQDGLESAIARPYSGYHRPIANKCAALLHGVIKNHPFADGNKRTAWILAAQLIDRSGYELVLTPSERIDDFVVAVADSQLSFEEIVEWFKLRIKRPQS